MSSDQTRKVFKLERRKQPYGEKGVRSSLEEVAVRATRGAYHPSVRAWTIKALKDAGSPQNSLDRAKAILARVRSDFIYVPDPYGVELMADAHVLAEGVFEGGDCDDLSIFTMSCTLAALSDAGVRCGVVGHSYEKDQQIGHVLGAMYYKGKWYYIDPSVNDERAPFGLAAIVPTRERVYAIPVEGAVPKVLCDASACLTGPRAVSFPEMETAGDFVGVAGVASAVGEIDDGWTKYLSELEEGLREHHDAIVTLRSQYYDEAKKMGINVPVPSSQKSDWFLLTAAQEEAIEDFLRTLRYMIEVLHEGVIGERKVALIEGTQTFGLELLPSDKQRIVLPPDALETFMSNVFGSAPRAAMVTQEERALVFGEVGPDGAPGRPQGTSPRVDVEKAPGAVGDVVVILLAAAAVALAVGVAIHAGTIANAIQKFFTEAILGLTKKRVLDCIEDAKQKGISPDDCRKAASEVDAGQVSRDRAEAERLQALAALEAAKGKQAASAGLLLLGVTAAVAVGYGIYYQRTRGRK